DAALAGHHLAVLLRHHLAGRVRNLLRHGVGNDPANRERDHMALFLPDVMAGADLADLFTRHPDALADPTAGTLDFTGARRTGAIPGTAGARIKRPAAGKLVMLGDDRPRAVLPFFAPIDRADLAAVSRPTPLTRLRSA